jgi:hypothetical protein
LHRADVDDAASPTRDHVLRHGLADKEHAVQIGLHDVLPIAVGKLMQRATALNPGVVDQDVQRANAAFYSVHLGFDLVGIGHIKSTFVHREAFRAQHLRGGGQGLGIAPVEYDRRTSLA